MDHMLKSWKGAFFGIYYSIGWYLNVIVEIIYYQGIFSFQLTFDNNSIEFRCGNTMFQG